MTRMDGYHFFGRRKSRALSKNLHHALDVHYPQMAICNDAGAFNLSFRQSSPVWLEIGFGAGEHLLAMAKAHPDRIFIAAEPYIDGLAKAVRDAHQADLKNIYFHNDDVRPLLATMPDAMLDGVVILFPDPWPKRRHWPRRLINQDLLGSLSRLMKQHAELRIASDHPSYITWLLSQFERRNDFQWHTPSVKSWLHHPPHWPATRYEEKRLDGIPHYFTFYRC